MHRKREAFISKHSDLSIKGSLWNSYTLKVSIVEPYDEAPWGTFCGFKYQGLKHFNVLFRFFYLKSVRVCT